MIRLLLIALMLTTPAAAEEVVAGLSQNRVSITTNFDGSEILVFGAVKREAAIPEDRPIEVVVTVAGPSEPVTIRRKDRRAGIWINVDAFEVDQAPSFYAVATSGTFADVLSFEEDFRHRVSAPRVIRADGAPDVSPDREEFLDALVRIRKEDGLYQTLIGAVEISEETLFRTSIALPANLTEGNYLTRFFLTRGGEVIDTHETVIFVRKVGLERFLYTLAHERPLIYGLMSIFIAIVAGWGASAVFRYVRG